MESLEYNNDNKILIFNTILQKLICHDATLDMILH